MYPIAGNMWGITRFEPYVKRHGPAAAVFSPDGSMSKTIRHRAKFGDIRYELGEIHLDIG